MVRMAETNESSFFECSKIQQIYLTQCVLFLIFETPWTVGCQAPLSTGFPRQGCWSGVPFPPPGVLFNPGIELVSPESHALAGASPHGTGGKEPGCQCMRARRFTPVFLPRESNRQRGLLGTVHRSHRVGHG